MSTHEPPLFDVLKRFTSNLAGSYDSSEVLYGLNESVVSVLGITGSGVSLANASGALQFMAASHAGVARLEVVQQETKQGPCHEAFRTGKPVVIDDVGREARWETYRTEALKVGVCAVAGIPMTANGQAIGALNLYADEVRHWSDDDIVAATVLADMATSYVVYADALSEARRLNAQLQDALDARVVIEQAKGILAGERQVSVQAAFEILRAHARRNNATLRSVAEAVVQLGLRP